jgi:hypothetical protein
MGLLFYLAERPSRIARGYGSSVSGFCNILAYRIAASTLLGFFAVTMTAGIVTPGGRRLPTSPRGGLAYTMRGGLSLVMVIRCREAVPPSGRSVPFSSAPSDRKRRGISSNR